MRSALVIASILCSLMFSPPAEASVAKPKKTVSSRKMGPAIRVEGGGWGSARKEEIESVLYSAADELLTRLPTRLAKPIVVTHTEGNPITLFEKGPKGEYLVRLSAKDRRWAQFAYQFAHELCHIMSNYDAHAGGGAPQYNQWFEETLCETASLYTLKGMASTWETAPPYRNWADYAPAFRSYADKLINARHRHLPPNTSFTAWLERNEDKLRRDPYLREKNEVVANLLLPLFEQDPANWETLGYLNLRRAGASDSLRQYLQDWYGQAPQEHKEFIRSVLALLGFKDLQIARAQVPHAPGGTSPKLMKTARVPKSPDGAASD